jgi:dynein intermediate chain 2
MAPQPDVLATEYIEKSPCVTTVQIAPEMSEHEVNTQAATFQSKGMVHLEGGWPKDIVFDEVEHTIRFRKKVEKDEDYIASISRLGTSVEQFIRQNNAVDIYEEYFSGDVVDHSSEQPYAKTLTVFKDPNPLQRSAQYISWYPDGARKVAVAYAIMQFQGQPEGMNHSSYIWDVNNPTAPDQELRAPSQLCSLNYNPKDPNVLLGGMYNGQMAFWDTRKGPSLVDASPIEKSHRDPVYDNSWLQSKTGTECVSVSTDGNVFWWDTRRLGEPVEELVLKGKNDTHVSGAVSIEYEAVAGPTKFMVGTEQGTIISCNRKAKTPADRVGTTYSGHHGPVYSLERNPFYPKYFMSIGDWTARVWMEDLKTPIMTTKYHSSYLTGGTWSPTRPGVFFTTRMDGVLDVWDYYYKQNDPVLSVQVSDAGLTSFNLHDQGKLMTTGDAKGNVCLLDLYEGLAVMQANEKQSIAQMFERETKREKNLEARQKELKMKARKEANAAKQQSVSDDADDAGLESVEKAFFEAVAGETMEETNPLTEPGSTDGPAM